MPWRAAVIGCGRIGSTFDEAPGAKEIVSHAGAYAASSQTELVAVCDVDEERARRCATKRGVAAWYNDPVHMFREQRPDIVSVCTPDLTHYSVVCLALQAPGVRVVLVEKPLTTSIEEATKLIALARARGVILMVNYPRRFSSAFIDTAQAIQAGAIGAARRVTGLYTKGTLHNGTHWFDLARFFLGEVSQVQGFDELREQGDDPTLDARLDFASGTLAHVHACREEDWSVFELDILGSRGRVRVIESGDLIEWYDILDDTPYPGYRTPVLRQRTAGVLVDVMQKVVGNLVDCLQGVAAPRCSAEDGLAALRIGLAVQKSAMLGRPIPVRELE